jgi:hypothetical protein
MAATPSQIPVSSDVIYIISSGKLVLGPRLAYQCDSRSQVVNTASKASDYLKAVVVYPRGSLSAGVLGMNIKKMCRVMKGYSVNKLSTNEHGVATHTVCCCSYNAGTPPIAISCPHRD